MRLVKSFAAHVLLAYLCLVLHVKASVDVQDSPPRSEVKDKKGNKNADSKSLGKENSNYDPSSNSNETILNIHIVPHTHDDVGWLKTVEQYYYGQNNTIRHACVSCILDSIIYALQLNPDRKFTYVEMGFFTMWWDEQSSEIKTITRDLVKRGQLVFVNGGWCMHDEATTHFVGMIDQTALGHEFLKKEFDYVPKVGWQLDPFGHSATQASLLTSEMGFNALYFGRIDYQDLHHRYEKKACEGIWDASEENLSDNAVFWGLTGNFMGNYGAPEGFCFDILCDDDPLYGMEEESLHKRVVEFLQKVKLQADRSRGVNVMLTMGSDFQYENAMVNFKSLDLLIDRINSMDSAVISSIFPDFDGIKAFYSNPEIYTEWKYEEYTFDRDNGSDNSNGSNDTPESIANLDRKTDDFFPYSDCDHCFWTGYFTSRPALKRLERVGSSFLQASRQIQALFTKNTKASGLPSSDISDGSKEIGLLDKVLAIAQHHDGVSGTSKQHVAEDYAKKIQAGINEASNFVSSVVKRMMLNDLNLDVDSVEYCQLRNESICAISQTESLSLETNFFLVLYNALGWQRSDIVSVPVSSNGTYEVLRRTAGNDDNWEEIKWSIVPNFNYAKIKGAANFNLLIHVQDMGPVSFNLFWIKKKPSDVLPLSSLNEVSPTNTARFLRGDENRKDKIHNGDLVVNSGKIGVHFKGGALSKVVNGPVEMDVYSEWGYYKSRTADSSTGPASGAYIFRPEVPNAKLEKIEPVPSKTIVVQTELVTEVHSHYEGSWVYQIVKVYKDKAYIDIEYTVGPIPIDDGVGKEVVSLVRTNITNEGTFYTDSNAREFLKRERSQRQTWDMEEFEPIAGNYYPVNTAIFIEDDSSSLTICTDRTQGGASLQDGNIELMVHRRILEDDSRGVGECLNETAEVMPYPPFGDASRKGDGLIITGIHRVLINGGTGARMARTQMDQLFSTTHSFAMKSSTASLENSLSPSPIIALPENIQLVTLKLIKNKIEGGVKVVLLRLGHAYGKHDCKVLGVPVHLDLSKLFEDYELVEFVEKTLSGNQEKWVWKQNKMLWNPQKDLDISLHNNSNVILIKPMEVKTFEITLKVKSSK